MKTIAFLVAVWAAHVLPAFSASAAFLCDPLDASDLDCVEPGGHRQPAPPPPTNPVGPPHSDVYLICLPFSDENGSEGHRCAAFDNSGAPLILPPR
jgi:hypothetical protein